jgi:hypothetical protein
MPLFELFDQAPGALALKWVLCFGVALALVFEAITCYFRFGLGLRATRDTRWMARYTRRLRIHHGYYGVGLLAFAPVASGGALDAVLILAIGLALSDAIHHWLVLWPVTGSPEFDLVYPRELG